MGYVLLAIVLIVAAVEALIGLKRGAAFMGVRIGLLALGTLIAALISKSLTTVIVMNIAGKQGLNGATLADVASGVLADTPVASAAGVLGVPLAAITLSAAIPFIFAGVFLICKLVTFLLYLAAKAIINKTEIAEQFSPNPAWSKLVGAVLGAVVGIYSCALIAVPISGLVSKVDQSGAVESALKIVGATQNGRQAGRALIDNAAVRFAMEMEKEGLVKCIVPVYAADTDGLADEVILSPEMELVLDIYESVVDSPAGIVCAVVGAEALAESVYENISEVTPEDVGGESVAEETYSFPETLDIALGAAEKVEIVMELVDSGEFTPELIDSVTDIVDYVLDSEILPDKTMVELVNTAIPVLEETIAENIGMGISLFGEYDDIDDFRKDVNTVGQVAKVVAGISSLTGGSSHSGSASSGDNGLFDNVDVDALLNDPTKRNEFIRSALELSNGADMLCDAVNSEVASATNGEITTALNRSAVRNASAETIIRNVDTIISLSAYADRESVTESEKAQINNMLNSLEADGLVNSAVIDMFREYVED